MNRAWTPYRLRTSAGASHRAPAPRARQRAPRPAVQTLEQQLCEASDAFNLWLHGSAWPLWSTVGVDHERGGFHESIGLDGRPTDSPRRLRVQARQVYAFAVAGELGWPGPWRSVARSGVEAMIQRYRRADGAFRTLASAEGAPLDDSARLYDQAFVLFALASAHRIGHQPERMRRMAASLAVQSLQTLKFEPGGWREIDAEAPFQSNPHMHLLEAALAWEAETEAPLWTRIADEIAELALARFIDAEKGLVREFFDSNWRPAPGGLGRIVEPGHQFEWAWLLERWSRLRGRADAARAAERLFDAGLAGIDRQRRVAVDSLFDDLTVRAAGARLWPQTEWLKACLILAERNDRRRRDYLTQALAAVEALRGYLRYPVHGGWRDRQRASGAFIEEAAPASTFYHVICALKELGDTVSTLRNCPTLRG